LGLYTAGSVTHPLGVALSARKHCEWLPVALAGTSGVWRPPAVQLLCELGDDDDPLGELLAGYLAFDLHSRAARGAPLAAVILGRVGVVQQADQPVDIAGELDVTVDDLGVHVCVEHDGGRPAEHLVAVCREHGDLVVQPTTNAVVGVRRLNGGED